MITLYAPVSHKDFLKKKENKDALYFCDILYRFEHNKKMQRRRDNVVTEDTESFVGAEIYSCILEFVFGLKKYNTVINKLVNNGIINIDKEERGSKTGKCYRYYFLDADKFYITKTEDDILLYYNNRLSDYFKDTHSIAKSCAELDMPEVYEKQRDTYTKSLSLDVAGATNACKLFNRKITKGKNGYSEYAAAKYFIRDISNNEFRYSVCRYGRQHTDLTNCAKIMRDFMKFKNNPSVTYTIDFKNSHPAILANLFRTSFLDNVFVKQICEKYGLWETIIEYKKNITKNAYKRFGVCATEQGLIYDTLKDKCNLDRDVVKSEMFHLFYRNFKFPLKKDSVDKKIEDAFIELYPVVYDFIKSLKEKGDYRAFNYMLQEIESYIIMSCVKVLQDNDIECITIHDSISFCEEPMKVFTLIKNKLKDLDFKVQLKPEHFEITEDITNELALKDEVIVEEIVEDVLKQYIHPDTAIQIELNRAKIIEWEKRGYNKESFYKPSPHPKFKYNMKPLSGWEKSFPLGIVKNLC